MNATAQIDLFPSRPASRIDVGPGAVIVCYGAGVDSTAMLIAMYQQGIRPDLITFADTGGEKPETLEQVGIMSDWLAARGWPRVTVCKYQTTTAPYDDLEGNNTANETLPSLAFGHKSCSIKWKQQPQDFVVKGCSKGPNKRDPHPLWLEAQASGVKPVKLIGYDAGPADLRRSKRLKECDDNFRYCYPLQQLGWTRENCIDAILDAGLAVPIKSACWFCPASQKWELYYLAGRHPELFERALELEHIAMTGKHSRWGSDVCTYGKDWEEFVNKPADQWPTTSITVGLGRTFAWNHWARVNRITNSEGRVIMPPAELLAKAEELKGQGGNAADRRTC
jgi:hypothetical protein